MKIDDRWLLVLNFLGMDGCFLMYLPSMKKRGGWMNSYWPLCPKADSRRDLKCPVISNPGRPDVRYLCQQMHPKYAYVYACWIRCSKAQMVGNTYKDHCIYTVLVWTHNWLVFRFHIYEIWIKSNFNNSLYSYLNTKVIWSQTEHLKHNIFSYNHFPKSGKKVWVLLILFIQHSTGVLINQMNTCKFILSTLLK